MGDQQYRAVGLCVEEAAVQLLLRLFVERAAYLVKQQDVAAVQQPSGDGYALGLPLAESVAPFAEPCVDAVGQVCHEVRAGRV